MYLYFIFECRTSVNLFSTPVGLKTCLSLKPRPNDSNMPTQHVATLLGATCCVRLATVLRHVGCCWLKFRWLKFDHFQQHPTCRNTSQHGGQTHATCCAQQCCDMLRWHVTIVWPGLNMHRKSLIRKEDAKN